MASNQLHFTTQLLEWDRHSNSREMPWKREKDPYKIWLSEIMLQQTRVNQGWNYYLNFIRKYPTIRALALSRDTDVFKLWEGLGYYSRCRNLISAAREIFYQQKGKFPTTYSEILKLPGVGPYTAAAISSFAFNLPYAVIDGNVTRVISRFFGIRENVDTATGKKLIKSIADKLIDKNEPARYNQSIMDLGAVVCKPKQPDCVNCPLNQQCYAYKHKLVNELPVKNKKPEKESRYFYYLVFVNENRVLTAQRTADDIWKHLYEFVLIEKNSPVSEGRLFKLKSVKETLPSTYRVLHTSPQYIQHLSHQTIYVVFSIIASPNRFQKPGFKWRTPLQISKLAFPGVISGWLKKGGLSTAT